MNLIFLLITFIIGQSEGSRSEMENEVFESAEEIVLTIDEVKDLVDDLEKDMLKSDEVDCSGTLDKEFITNFIS